MSETKAGVSVAELLENVEFADQLLDVLCPVGERDDYEYVFGAAEGGGSCTQFRVSKKVARLLGVLKRYKAARKAAKKPNLEEGQEGTVRVVVQHVGDKFVLVESKSGLSHMTIDPDDIRTDNP